MASRNNTGLPQSLIQRGPDMGNVPMQDSYLRIKQNFDAVYRSLNNILLAAAPNTLSKPQLDLIQKELQAAGSNPLNLTGLIPINNLRAIQFTGTHSKRKQNFQPSAYPVGTLFFETDRTVLYTVLKPGPSNQWYYETGIMSSTFANRPSDLAQPDAGFLFYATDQSITYRWTGAAWVIKGEVGTIFADTHAAKAGYTPADYPINSEYFETDRTSLYRNSGTAWLFMAGLMRAAFASRPSDLGTSDEGFGFYATDTFTAYYWTGSAWVAVPSVNTLNTLTGDITIAAGTNISIGQNNNTKVITISAANGNNGGITSVNALTGPALTIAANANNDTQVSAAGNNITINAADQWNNTTVAVAASNDNGPSPATALCRWVRRGKTIHLEIYWTGTIAAVSRDVTFGLPANLNGNITYQTLAVWGTENSVAILPSAALLVPGSPDLAYIRGTANYPANNTLLFVLGGTYESS